MEHHLRMVDILLMVTLLRLMVILLIHPMVVVVERLLLVDMLLHHPNGEHLLLLNLADRMNPVCLSCYPKRKKKSRNSGPNTKNPKSNFSPNSLKSHVSRPKWRWHRPIWNKNARLPVWKQKPLPANGWSIFCRNNARNTRKPCDRCKNKCPKPQRLLHSPGTKHPLHLSCHSPTRAWWLGISPITTMTKRSIQMPKRSKKKIMIMTMKLMKMITFTTRPSRCIRKISRNCPTNCPGVPICLPPHYMMMMIMLPLNRPTKNWVSRLTRMKPKPVGVTTTDHPRRIRLLTPRHDHGITIIKTIMIIRSWIKSVWEQVILVVVMLPPELFPTLKIQSQIQKQQSPQKMPLMWPIPATSFNPNTVIPMNNNRKPKQTTNHWVKLWLLVPMEKIVKRWSIRPSWIRMATKESIQVLC
mmetsp:Transcript_1699/g.3659  ORF Transcript_1699/g.3659 Transcript_1699/m.3659 type:complete len:413 (+) Transcript_1699:392-1630(+)